VWAANKNNMKELYEETFGLPDISERGKQREKEKCGEEERSNKDQGLTQQEDTHIVWRNGRVTQI